MKFSLLFDCLETWQKTKGNGSCDTSVDAKDLHTKPESTVRQAQTATASNRGVPVNLTCKLTRNQQTVKFESVSAGFPNNSRAAYRQDVADTENDRSNRINGC